MLNNTLQKCAEYDILKSDYMLRMKVMISRNNTAKIIVSALLALFFWTMTCINISAFFVNQDEIMFMGGYFTVSLISSAAVFLLGAFRFNFNKTVSTIAGIIAYIAAIVGAMLISILFSGGFGEFVYLFFVNIAFYMAIAAIALIISGNMRASAISSLVVSTLFNGISFMIYCFRGSSLTPTDIISIGTAMNVAAQYEFEIKYEMFAAFTAATALIMLVFKFPLKLTFRYRWLIMRGAGLIALVASVLFIGTADASLYDISIYDQHYANLNFGSAYSFYINATKLGLKQREGYNPEWVDIKLSRYEQAVAEPEVKPNIIVIMNESFADLSVIGEFETNTDFMPYLRGLHNNAIKGELLVSPFGGYTCNTEYEFLTGMSTGVLNAHAAPYMQMMFDYLPYSLPMHMKQLGYHTMAMHPFYADSWNREIIYDYMDFDEFVSIENLDEYSEYPEYLRWYVSDKGNYGAILNYLYNKETDAPSFVFNITMQNHGGYTVDEFESEIFLQDMNGSYPQTEQYLTLIKHSDDALRYLLESLKRYEKPTLVVMFGDHLPAIEREFYEEVYGDNLDSLSNNELYKRYVVPFVVWANYDIPEQQGVKSSPCYLSNIMMEVAGLPKSRVQLYLDELKTDIVQINPMCYFDSNGDMHTLSESERLAEYYDLQYALLTGENLNYDFYNYTNTMKLPNPAMKMPAEISVEPTE